MGVSNSFAIIGVHILNDNFVFRRWINHFSSSLLGPLWVLLVFDRTDLSSLLCKKSGHIWDTVTTTVRLVESMLLRHDDQRPIKFCLNSFSNRSDFCRNCYYCLSLKSQSEKAGNRSFMRASIELVREYKACLYLEPREDRSG